MDHSLHKDVADELERHLGGRGELIRDPACDGGQHLPLFVGPDRGRDTQMCNVDLLVLSGGRVKVIVEIEESGFLPTKICGKLLQAALATHFIHDAQGGKPLPYDDDVLFIEVVDGAKCLKPGSRKKEQGELIASEIQKLLPLRRPGITEYRLFFVGGEGGLQSLDPIGEALAEFLQHGYNQRPIGPSSL